MMTFAAVLAGIAVCLAIALFVMHDQRRLGEKIERERKQREFIDASKDVVGIRDRLNSDPDYLKRVQDRFIRD